MTVDAALLAGRRAAEARMRDQCTISRVIDEDTDPLTGKVTPILEQVYPSPAHPAGKCRLQSYEGYEAERHLTGTPVTVQRLSVHLPVGAYRINVGDILEVVSSTDDPLLAGRKFRLTQEAPYKSQATAYRVFVDYIAT